MFWYVNPSEPIGYVGKMFWYILQNLYVGKMFWYVNPSEPIGYVGKMFWYVNPSEPIGYVGKMFWCQSFRTYRICR